MDREAGNMWSAHAGTRSVVGTKAAVCALTHAPWAI